MYWTVKDILDHLEGSSPDTVVEFRIQGYGQDLVNISPDGFGGIEFDFRYCES